MALKVSRSPPRSRKAPSPPPSDSPTGETAGASKAAAPPVVKEIATAAAAPSAGSTLHSMGQFVTSTLGALAAILTSPTFAMVIRFTPAEGNDGFGVKAAAAAVRIVALLFTLVLQKPKGIKVAGALMRFVTTVAVEAAILLPQPAFTTAVGGPFKLGDAGKAASMRYGRQTWAATESLSPGGLAVLALCVVLYLAMYFDKPSKAWLRGYPRLALDVIAKPAKTIAFGVLFYRMWSVLLHYVYGGYVALTRWMTALPPLLLMSRHEVSLFEWSFETPAEMGLIVAGDLLISNAALPPPMGLAGALLLRGGLLLGGTAPQPGFYLMTAAWALAAAYHVAFEEEKKKPPPQEKGTEAPKPPKPPLLTRMLRSFVSPWVDIKHYGETGGIKAGSAKLKPFLFGMLTFDSLFKLVGFLLLLHFNGVFYGCLGFVAFQAALMVGPMGGIAVGLLGTALSYL